MITLIALLLTTTPTVRCLPDDPAVCTSAVDRGVPAPFSGTLYTPQAAAETTAALEGAEERLALAVTATATIWRLRWEGAVKLSEDRLRLRDELIEKQAQELRQLRDPPFYERPVVLVLGSVVLTALAISVPIVAIEIAAP